jgi:glutathione synthase/RimK-type ligase-like ATP-grasp enzyme
LISAVTQPPILQEHIATRPGEDLRVWVVDLWLDGDGYNVCEVNGAPRFAGFEQAIGLNVAREILKHCCSRMEPHRQRDDSPAAISS